jgi:eukaryotic-like serine/threonine-protein kinase
MLGAVLGTYRLLRRLGEGGMGAVFLAEHTLIGRVAAVKILLPQYSDHPEVVRRFFNEARAAAAVRHPGIVEIYDFGHDDEGRAFIVMEYLEGVTLTRRIEGEPPIERDEALDIAAQIASVLAAAHEAGIVHRDLKPENIILSPHPDGGRPSVRVLDFGIAKLADDDSDASVKTRTGSLLGTPAYMAPEQCKGAARVDHRADQYALGCILFEMLSGRPPFWAAGAGEVVAQQIYESPPWLSEVASGVDPALDELVMRLLDKEPDRRFESARALRTALERLMIHGDGGADAGYLGIDTVEEPPPRFSGMSSAPGAEDAIARPAGHGGVSSGAPFAAPRRRRPATTAALGGAVLLAIAGGLWLVHAVGEAGAPLAGVDTADAGTGLLAAAGDAASRGVARPEVEPLVTDAATPPDALALVVLVIESAPPGAEVFREEDGAHIGSTPHRERVARGTGMVRFVLEKAGYEPVTLTLDTGDDVAELVELRPAAAPQARRAATRRRAGLGREPSPPATSSPQPEPEGGERESARRLDPFTSEPDGDTTGRRSRSLNPFGD